MKPLSGRNGEAAPTGSASGSPEASTTGQDLSEQGRGVGETVHQDTGLLGFTTKHLYFSGGKKKFRVRYDRIVDFEPYDDGFGIMRDAQTAKPQRFKTGDGWFAYNLAVNLAQM